MYSYFQMSIMRNEFNMYVILYMKQSIPIEKISLTQSQGEEMKLVICHSNKLSLTQCQEEVQKQDNNQVDWKYDFGYQKQ